MPLILDGSAGATFPAGGTGNISGSAVGTTDTQTVTNKSIIVPAGTSSTSYLQFTSGALQTSSTAGTFEYDGNVAYFCPAASARGILPAVSTFCLLADTAGVSGTGGQSIFGQASYTVWQVPTANITYAFELNVGMTKTTSATSHTIQLGFGGLATVSNIFYRGSALGVAGSSTISGYNASVGQVAANTTSFVNAISAAIANANSHFSVTINGVVRFSSTGTFIPQYNLTATLTGTYTTLAGSYFSIWPLGNQAGSGGTEAVRVGNWT